eukprot:9809375-Prorocentrum_lima.AAC.1
MVSGLACTTPWSGSSMCCRVYTPQCGQYMCSAKSCWEQLEHCNGVVCGASVSAFSSMWDSVLATVLLQMGSFLTTKAFGGVSSLLGAASFLTAAGIWRKGAGASRSRPLPRTFVAGAELCAAAGCGAVT